jgi:hypothetical protein
LQGLRATSNGRDASGDNHVPLTHSTKRWRRKLMTWHHQIFSDLKWG